MVDIKKLINDSNCYEAIRNIRWSEGIKCVYCKSSNIKHNGHKKEDNNCKKYKCNDCGRYFDDLTGTIFAGRHKSVKIWILCLFLMGLNLSNSQIAQELDLSESEVHKMATQLREGIEEKTPEVKLQGTVEMDEVYIVAGHKGQPEEVKKKGRKGRRNRLKGARGRGTLEKEKPPVFGMIERGGEVVIQMLPNVKQETIEPIIKETVQKGSVIYTDEYAIYNNLEEMEYEHKTVNHSIGEYARDEDGDGHYEVHVNTMEGFWSLLRSWLRPHRGIAQNKLPSYLAFFQYTHNTRARGKKLLPSLLGLLLAA